MKIQTKTNVNKRSQFGRAKSPLVTCNTTSMTPIKSYKNKEISYLRMVLDKKDTLVSKKDVILSARIKDNGLLSPKTHQMCHGRMSPSPITNFKLRSGVVTPGSTFLKEKQNKKRTNQTSKFFLDLYMITIFGYSHSKQEFTQRL